MAAGLPTRLRSSPAGQGASARRPACCFARKARASRWSTATATRWTRRSRTSARRCPARRSPASSPTSARRRRPPKQSPPRERPSARSACWSISPACASYEPLADAKAETWERILAVNLLSYAWFTQAAIADLRAQRGSIVNISSTHAVNPRAGMGQYDVTKAGIVSMTKTLAFEEARHGVRVNAVCPGATLTPFHQRRAAAAGRTIDRDDGRRLPARPLGRSARGRVSDPLARVRRGVVCHGERADGGWRTVCEVRRASAQRARLCSPPPLCGRGCTRGGEVVRERVV